eukprot:jgi/Psemu1/51125/gm1.51125_g
MKLETIHKHVTGKLRIHFNNSCPLIPVDVAAFLRTFRKLKKDPSYTKDLCVQWAKDLGVVETEKGLKFERQFPIQSTRETNVVYSPLKPVSNPSVKLPSSSVNLSIGPGSKCHHRGSEQTKESPKTGKSLSGNDFSTANSLHGLSFDKAAFHEIANEYFESLSTQKKALLIGQHYYAEKPSSSKNYSYESLLPPRYSSEGSSEISSEGSE